MKILMQHPHGFGEISGVLTYIEAATAALAPLAVEARIFSTHQTSWAAVWTAVRECDLVHLNSNHIPLLLAARLLGRPILIKYHYPFWWENVARPYQPQSLLTRIWSDARFHWEAYRDIVPAWKRLKPVIRAVTRSLCRVVVALSVDHRTACSRYLAETTDLPCYTEVDYNPADLSRAPSPPPEGWPGAQPLFLFVGRVDRTKGVDVLLQAASQLAQAGRVFRVELIGDGDHLEELRTLILDLGIGDRVEILGRCPRSKVQDAMRRALAVVVPSRWNDPAPYVILEALAAGRVCLGSRMGGIPELIDDPRYLFENGDAAGLAQRLTALLDDPPQTISQAHKMRTATQAKCDTPIAAARLKGIYEGLLSGKSSAGR